MVTSHTCIVSIKVADAISGLPVAPPTKVFLHGFVRGAVSLGTHDGFFAVDGVGGGRHAKSSQKRNRRSPESRGCQGKEQHREEGESRGGVAHGEDGQRVLKLRAKFSENNNNFAESSSDEGTYQSASYLDFFSLDIFQI